MQYNSENRGIVPLLLLLSTVKVTRTTMLKICDGEYRYEYDMNKCPGGIQIRNVDHWFSKSREQICICGEGSVLQFSGKSDHHKLQATNVPGELKSTEGTWTDYNLNGVCEMLKGTDSSVLLINAKKYRNPANFPSRAIELNVETFQPRRLPGVYKISMKSGHNLRSDVPSEQLLRTVIFNNHEPIIIEKDAKSEVPEYVCSYNFSSPDVVLANYITTAWGKEDLVESCKKNYKAYERVKYSCPVSCKSLNKFDPPQPGDNQSQLQFLQILTTMGEIAIRLKYLEKIVYFEYEDHPYAAILQNSCRVFHRAFPNVVRWETLMNAVALFAIAFEGMMPTRMERSMFDQMKVLLGRCAIQEGRHQMRHNTHLFELCAPNRSEYPNPILKNGGHSDAERLDQQSEGGSFNIVIKLLWKVVQFVHANCLSSTDHYPNVHHAYTSAMIEMFSTPAVQLLWYQQGKYELELRKAMVHIFPELSDHVLPTIDFLMEKLKLETYFSLLRRPKVPNLENVDMRCAAQGKLIFGGKACCYQRNENKKFYYFHKVAYATL